MFKLRNISYFIFLWLVTSCTNYENPKESSTNHGNSFMKYYGNTFNEQNIIGEKLFIIIPCSGCSGCEQKVYTVFTTQLLDSEDFNLIICDPGDKGMLSPNLQAKNIEYDFLGKMVAYDFGSGYPSVIIVRNNQVVEQYRLSPDIIYWLGNFLEAYDTKVLKEN